MQVHRIRMQDRAPKTTEMTPWRYQVETDSIALGPALEIRPSSQQIDLGPNTVFVHRIDTNVVK
jgi:hypothetical protein